jgi:hypothetical protein
MVVLLGDEIVGCGGHYADHDKKNPWHRLGHVQASFPWPLPFR